MDSNFHGVKLSSTMESPDGEEMKLKSDQEEPSISTGPITILSAI